MPYIVYNADGTVDFTQSTRACCINSQDSANCGGLLDAEDEEKEEWICSYSYYDTAYSMLTCPFNQDKCGARNRLYLYDEGDDSALHI